MATEIKHGIVIDNKDIHETGKIRVFVIDQDTPVDYRNKSVVELKTLLSNLDKTGNYKPWQKSTITKNADPYLAEPFLPKQINLIPEEGQLVKIMIYGDSLYREYVGPQLSSLENQKENYVNALVAYKTVAKRDLIKNGYTNKVQDFSLYGNNSQLVLSNNEFFLRTSAQDQSTKRKSTDMTLFQQSTFNTTLTLDKTKKSVVKEPEKIISHLLELTIQKKFREVLNEKTILATIKLLSLMNHKNQNGKTGVTSSTYVGSKEYTDAELELQFEVKTDDVLEINKIVDEIRLGLLSKKLPQLSTLSQTGVNYTTSYSTPGADVTVTDFRQMTRNFTVITDRKEVDIFGFVVRTHPTQKLYSVNDDTLNSLGVSYGFRESNPKFYAKELNNLSLINNLVNQYKNSNKVESNLTTSGPTVLNVEESTPKMEAQKDSFSVQASRKILLLSTQLKPNLISRKPEQYGLTQTELADLIDPKKNNTFSMVRGEELVKTMIELIDLFLAHGHSLQNTTKNSLEQDTTAKLVKMKEDLSKKVNADLSGGPLMLNQYIRVN